jgi:putative component of membrane protein insertase Oxa1/YidC/SpoIIIJ protein YidD
MHPSRFPRRAAIAIINVYQHTLSLDHGPLRRLFPGGVCVYEQTCSQYGKEVIETYGVRKGGTMLIRRILSCR